MGQQSHQEPGPVPLAEWEAPGCVGFCKMASVAKKREILCTFILETHCTHELTLSSYSVGQASVALSRSSSWELSVFASFHFFPGFGSKKFCLLLLLQKKQKQNKNPKNLF